MAKPEWVEQFLARWHLQIPEEVDQEVVEGFLGLRQLLQRALEALLETGSIPEGEREKLNEVLRSALLRRQMVVGATYHIETLPVERNWAWVHSEIVASFVEMIERYDVKRLRICANPNCRWVFYDESKSRTRRYCTVEKCANLMKMRRFHARHKGMGRGRRKSEE